MDVLIVESPFLVTSFSFANGSISWENAKESIITSSTMKAEFATCFEATAQGLWLRNFILEHRVIDTIAKPLKIYCDISVAVFSKNNKYSKSVKHMELKYLSLKKFRNKEC